ncbi:hypothetical protein BJ508DRAFT_335305 [Ascobolus immersus RN42]|uniref:Extracellular membrane protein CFEM domain-containing protein n=1 Tax=Ascobolus immersus RN42 TaxID=1160509 RepID=A0A3N4HR89_ASCIM|nr:hypothetical protein BJ508DRAFT_335305 [Ascobolus immersus RN42]
MKPQSPLLTILSALATLTAAIPVPQPKRYNFASMQDDLVQERVLVCPKLCLPQNIICPDSISIRVTDGGPCVSCCREFISGTVSGSVSESELEY